MIRGRAVSTSSPKKASIIRFCKVLSKMSSTRSQNSGNLQRMKKREDKDTNGIMKLMTFIFLC